jgi:ElaB/YqjD/DUF883 family membrane-anchored ribosome-binding protein
MGKDPDAIRQEIEQTRTEMGETVEAIGYKADVPSRTREAVAGKVEAVKDRVSETATRAKEAVTGTAERVGDRVGDTGSRVSDRTPDRQEVKQKTRRAVGLAQENPLGLAVGAVALGFLAGLAVPVSRMENEKIGPLADEVKDKVRETGQEALERGKVVAQEAAQSAVQTARERGQEHGQDLAGSARQNAQDVRSEARSTF